jgi:protoheme IX farnesyltransferase
MGPIYFVGAAVGGLYFIARSVAFVRDPGPKAAAMNFKASLLQLSLLLIAAIVDRGFFV